MLNLKVTGIYPMPDLSPKAHVPKLRDTWYILIPNPEDPDDNSLCIQIIEEKLGQAILEIIEEHHIGSDENRDNNIKESITE